MFKTEFKTLTKYVLIGLITASMVFTANDGEAKTTRIKDIVDIEGVRDNMLVGYGLVVGLNGTGDSLNNSPFTQPCLSVWALMLKVRT